MGAKTEVQDSIFNSRLANKLIENKGNYASTWKQLHPDKTYSSDTVASNSCGNYIARNKKDLQKIFKELLFTGKNTTLQGLAKELDNQITANKSVVYNSAGDIKEVPDNAARMDAIKTTAKIIGIMADKEVTDIPTYQINIGSINLEKLDDIVTKLTALRSAKEESSIIDIEPEKKIT